MPDRDRLGLFAGATLAVMIIPATLGLAARSGEGPQLAATDAAPARPLTANVALRFVQEDGPSSGHVRVELTPSDRPLNFFEARSAAQQAFLEALDEPGLGDDLQRIRVVVRLVPDDRASATHSYLFLKTSPTNWTVTGAE